MVVAKEATAASLGGVEVSQGEEHNLRLFASRTGRQGASILLVDVMLSTSVYGTEVLQGSTFPHEIHILKHLEPTWGTRVEHLEVHQLDAFKALMPRNSTSKIRSEFGGMGPLPDSP